MIHGVTRPEEVAHLGLSNRLLARLGALLKKKVSVSLAVLEASNPGSRMEALLLSSAALQDAATLDTAAIKALAQSSGVDIALAVGEDDGGFRVICLEDQLEADATWQTSGAQPLAARPDAAAVTIGQKQRGDAGSAMFGEEHLSRTRLTLMTSASADERIEALRVLIFAPLNPVQKTEAILHGLADADERVRAEAAGLLPGLGVSADVAAALAELNIGDTPHRIAAAEKLDKIATRGANELEDAAVIVCAYSALKSDSGRTLNIRLLELLLGRAGTLGRNSARLGELMRLIAGLLAASFKSGPSSRELEELSAPALKLVRELARHYPEEMLPVLKTERERAPDFVTEAFMLTALFDLIQPGTSDEDALLSIAASYLAHDTEEGRDSRAIGALMTRRGSAALDKLCAVFPDATPAAKRHLLLLLDELCRLPQARAGDLELAAQVLLQAMEEGSKSLRMAAMECRLAGDARIPAETRRKLAEAFLDSTSDFSFDFDVDKAESGVVRMGIPAIAPLLSRIGRERAPAERVRAARLLGELALSLKSEPGQFQTLQTGLTDALRRLEAASLETDFPDRGEVFVALGKVIASPAASVDANAVVTRTLLDAAAGTDPALVPRALEGAAYLASSRRAQPEFIAETVKLLKAALDAPEPEQLDTRSVDASGATVFEIRGGEHYAVSLPSVLSGLERVALAPNTPASVTREIGALLLERWKDVCAGRRVWGPANSYALSQALRSIALSEKCSAELRLDIVKGLLARYSQTPVMHAITEILAADDTHASGGIALDVGFAILGRRDAQGRFDANDRGDILTALSRLAGRKFLAAPPSENERVPEAFRRTVVNELSKAVKDDVPGAGAALQGLSAQPAIPADLRAEITARLQKRK